MGIILSAKQSTNSEIFPDILKLYAKTGNLIADVTYGRGIFWKNVDISQYDFYPSDLSKGVDCRALPYEDEHFDMVVLDPPYIYNPKRTVKKSISECYRVNETLDLSSVKAVLNLYYDGMKEAKRILKSNGFLVVKCQDQIESGKQNWVHINIHDYALSLGFYAKDLFVLLQKTQPTIRWKQQKHSRKNFSYFWVFEKRKRQRPS